MLEKSSFLSLQVFLSIILLILTILHVCSAITFFFIVSLHLVFRSLLLDTLVSPELSKSGYSAAQCLAYVLCSAVPLGLLWVMQLPMSMATMEMFVPLTGRLGAVVPPDVVIGVLTAVFVILTTFYMVSGGRRDGGYGVWVWVTGYGVWVWVDWVWGLVMGRLGVGIDWVWGLVMGRLGVGFGNG